MALADLEPALDLCTHLIYGHAGIRSDNHKIISLNSMVDLDLDGSSGHYRLVTALKQRFPNLKILLSVGGNADTQGNNPTAKYLTALETTANQLAFVNSAYDLVKIYDFDGIDLAWQFPASPPTRIQSGLGSLWAGVKKLVGSVPFVDDKVAEHRNGFTALLKEMKRSFSTEIYRQFIVSVTINPNVPLGKCIVNSIHVLYLNVCFIYNR